MKSIFLFLLSLVTSLVATAQTRETISLEKWNFSKDSLKWQCVRVPHDWAISGPFDKKWDLQVVAITQDGEKEKSEKSGRSGALPWIGKGFYTTEFNLPKLNGKHAVLCFDGAMAEPVVYVNGREAGRWEYGYTPFCLDITPYIKKGKNHIAVSLNNVEESSRWYPGAGLYRPVSLQIVPRKHLDAWTTFVKTMAADARQATVSVEAQVAGFENGDDLSLAVSLLNDEGRSVADASVPVGSDGLAKATLTVNHPQLWSPESPYLYRISLRLMRGHHASTSYYMCDHLTMKTGLRTVSVDAKRGFSLNGQSRKLKGVCLHHDLGPLGSAVNKAALIRQVKMLKDMGCDAIRTSHNIPSQMQMEVYDSLGMMVMGESFDMWNYPKCKNGYCRFFKDWSDRDLTHLVLANRNHPSLVMYSIGNEIPEQGSNEGHDLSQHLQDLCHRLDPTRPVTQGLDRAEAALQSGVAQLMDIPAFNYRVYRYDDNMRQLPQGFLLGSETASTVSSRGVYKFPVEFKVASDEGDGQVTSYDTEWCGWSNLPEEDFMAMDDKPYTIGQFVWTGFDYLGEPTPYNTYWPSRSSYFGIIDLAGLPKDRYYLYRSVWNTQSHTLHVLPHWTWPGREGEVTPVFVYTDYPEAELFVNGKSQGRRRKAFGLRTDDQHASTSEVAAERARRYRLMWNDVRYEPGELRVVAYDNQGKPAAEHIVRTAGQASAIKLEADRTTIHADGDDLSYITVSLVDNNGTELPTSTDNIDVEVSCAGSLRGICNGDATSLEVFTEPHMKMFSGKLVITVQAASLPGTIHVKVCDKQAALQKTIDIKTL